MEDRLTLFKRSAGYLWNDEHIGKEMLKAHLDNSKGCCPLRRHKTRETSKSGTGKTVS